VAKEAMSASEESEKRSLERIFMAATTEKVSSVRAG
jgi:hypothetical protein